MIRIVFLGTSASVPSVGRNLCSVGLRYEGDVYLFDCGEGTQRQMMKYRLSYAKTRAVFISHLHADHYLGVAGLCHTLHMIGRTKEDVLHVYGPRGTRRVIEGLGCNYEFLKVEEVGEGEVHKAGEPGRGSLGFSVRAFAVEHGRNALGYIFEENAGRNFDKPKCDALGIKGLMFKELEQKGEVKAAGGKKVKIADVTVPKKGRKIVYTGDTRLCDGVVKAAEGADLLIHDGTFGEERRQEADERDHATAGDAAKAAKKAKVKELVVTHISNRYEKTDALLKEARQVFANTKIAQDGMELDL
ncbi:Ribonuclease Z [Candidatus Burarchaeum australiense]|nr:Ribonuclease Z [Candidatus Burarchaeum australiense]